MIIHINNVFLVLSWILNANDIKSIMLRKPLKKEKRGPIKWSELIMRRGRP